MGSVEVELGGASFGKGGGEGEASMTMACLDEDAMSRVGEAVMGRMYPNNCKHKRKQQRVITNGVSLEFRRSRTFLYCAASALSS